MPASRSPVPAGPDPGRRRAGGRPAPSAATGRRRSAPRPNGRRARTPWVAATTTAAAGLVLSLLSAEPPASAGQPDPGALQRAFTEAADHYRVPRSVLLAVSYLQSRWDSHDGAPSVSGGYGPMHLTDARTALAHSRAAARTGQGAGAHDSDGHYGAEDARGDTARATRTEQAAPPARASRASRPAKPPEENALPARLRTLERAARLTGLPQKRLRESPAANVRGGAALLAAAQRRQGHPLGADPADWYAAVAAFPSGGGTDGKAAAGGAGAGKRDGAAFADDVYDVLRTGERRTTDSGQRVSLPAAPRLRPDPAQAGTLRSARTGGAAADAGSPKSGASGAGKPQGQPECPASVSCEWLPAPYEEYTNDQGERDYGNHDVTRRPRSQPVDYIVVHDTEETWDKSVKLAQDPKYVSWNYTMRSSDGHVAQHVPTKDVAWHAGNWYVNSASVGVEHEGYLTEPDAWFTEEMYRASARLVRYLADKYDIPLDRQHILGHDNVPGTTTGAIPGMHTDPGPYFDWDHYFALLGRPFTPRAAPGSPLVTILPDYDGNRPDYTGCDAKEPKKPCADHGSDAVRLHTAPDAGSPLVKDAGLHPRDGGSTTGVNDTGARASTGQQYVVAGRHGDWTAVWYLGRKAWFLNPEDDPAAVPSEGRLVVPRKGRDDIPVYGRAYPEESAYPKGVPVQKLSPLPYTVGAGQAYASGGKVRGAYLWATRFDPDGKKYKVVRGGQTYYQIQLGHRIAFVKAEDVRVVDSGDYHGSDAYRGW